MTVLAPPDLRRTRPEAPPEASSWPDGVALDALASEVQYASHVLPVWLRTTPRGTFWVRTEELQQRLLRGLADQEERAGIRVLGGGVLTRPVIVASAKDLATVRRRRAPAVAYMEHGVGQSYPGDPRWRTHVSYAGGPGRDGCGMILAPNRFAADRWRARYPTVPVHVIGATRRLPPPDDPGRSLLVVSFHWPGPAAELRSALPHYRDSLVLLRDLGPVAGHSHPRYAGTARAVFARAGIPFIEDLEEVARRATVYAVDNSSTLWELGLTRPVIALNAPWYRRDVEHGLRFWSHVPASADGPSELLTLAERYLSGGETERERAYRLLVSRDLVPTTSGAVLASERLAEWLGYLEHVRSDNRVATASVARAVREAT